MGFYQKESNYSASAFGMHVNRNKNNLLCLSSKRGLTLFEIMISMVIFGLVAAGLFTSINYFSSNITQQSNYIRAADLADLWMKNIREGTYSDALSTLGMTSDQTVASSAVILETTNDGYTISATGSPNATYGTTANDAITINIIVNWSLLNENFSRTYQMTIVNGGLFL